MLWQVLELVTQSGGVSAQLNEVHHQPPVPAVSLHCSVCSAGNAALRRTVRTRLRVTLTCHLVHAVLGFTLYKPTQSQNCLSCKSKKKKKSLNLNSGLY